MAHLLFLSWWWPYPANNGSKQRIYQLLRQLSRDDTVSLLSFAEANDATPERIDHLRQFCARVEAIPKPEYQSTTLKATLGYLSRWPRSLVDVYSPAMAAAIERLQQQTPVDFVIASELQTLRYLELLPQIPSILETPELTSFHDRVAQAPSNRSRLRAQLTLSKLENTLRTLLNRGVAMTVVSEVERYYLQRLAPPDGQIAVVPNGVDTNANRPNPHAMPPPNTLIYSGAVTYDANYDAVDYFIHDVWPLVLNRVPQARFSVTGSTSPIDVSHLAAHPGVTFTGYLPEVAPVLQNTWALVVPLRIGGGTRLKILEAMALGVPVISTPKGAEGLHVQDGKNILLADNPAQMADTICHLFADPSQRARLIENGRQLVEQEYDWSVISRQMQQVMDRMKR
ncbi:MAG TPA: glycosyltransferase family 4 protein [Phototrophicaceae bacterium]|nr:glycosyltransferase family 4 protein [Phototrophicaceae bacterium]